MHLMECGLLIQLILHVHVSIYSFAFVYISDSFLGTKVCVNPLTTDDECTRHTTLTACYQLVQSVLKIGFALAKKVG